MQTGMFGSVLLTRKQIHRKSENKWAGIRAVESIWAQINDGHTTIEYFGKCLFQGPHIKKENNTGDKNTKNTKKKIEYLSLLGHIFFFFYYYEWNGLQILQNVKFVDQTSKTHAEQKVPEEKIRDPDVARKQLSRTH